jgi:hypothetical protein
MIDGAEVQRSLAGAWRLFLGKPDAMLAFDTSVDGFWRSFGAIILVAPLYALTALADRHDMLSDAIASDDIGAGPFWAAKALTLMIDWVTLPILLALIADFIGIRRGYPAYVVARNWATVLMIVPFAAIGLLDVAGIASPTVLAVPSLVALAATFRMSYEIARKSLGANPEVAVALVVLDFLVSLGIVISVDKLFGLPSLFQ